MAQFQNMIITRAGLDMIAQSQAGGTLIFTKGKLGDGQIGDQSIPDLTDLINAKMSVELSSVTAKTEGHVEVRFIVDNTDLDVGFFVREVGIYAKINDEGVEQLYGYANAGNYTNYLADKSVPIESIITKIDLVVGNASNIAFTTDKSIVYVTLEDLEEAIDTHNKDSNAHEPAFAAHNADGNAHKDMVGATSGVAGKRGMVPAPAAGTANRYLKADGTWGTIDTMNGASSSAAGSAGLVPAPDAGAQNKFLRGDGTWQLLIKAIAEAAGIITITNSDNTTSTITQILKAIQDGNGNNIVNTYATKTELNTKAPLASPALTGTPTAPTAAKTTDSTQIATTAFVKDVVADYATLTQLNAKANIASPTFTGSPKSTTPASSDNSTRIATTAFVKALVGAANNGGIVSANLAQNGYVKFANGFILQWGRLTTNNTGNITFPLSFSSFCAIALSTQSAYISNAALSWSTYWTLNLNGFTCAPYDATCNAGKSYIAVGK